MSTVARNSASSTAYDYLDNDQHEEEEQQQHQPAELEKDTICKHSGKHFPRGVVYAPIKDHEDSYLGEWEYCRKCRTPICGFCMASGCCSYVPVADYKPPTVFINPDTPRIRTHTCPFANTRY